MTNLSATERPRPTAIRAAWLFDGTTGALVADPLVVLDGATIARVEPAGAPTEDLDVVDLAGATLLPGLVDPHVHLVFDASTAPVANLAARDDAAVLEQIEAAGRATLRAGVTTVRDLGDRDYLTLDRRGRPGQPTVVAAGPPITTPGGHCHFLGGATEPNATAVRAAVREHAERGVDVVKIMASGGTLTPGTRQECGQFSAELLRAAVDEAHRHGLPVTAHAHGTGAIADALAAGVDGMEHVTFWTADGVDSPDELIAAIAARQVVVGATVGQRAGSGSAPPPEVAARIPLMLRNLARLYELGAPLVAGTDAGIGPPKQHGVLPYAVPVLRQVGLDAADALRTITSVAAQVCGLGNRKGRVAAGYDADLLAVDGDPLADPAALHRVRAVWTRGRAVAL